MPHVVVLTLVGVGLWAGYRLMRREMARVEQAVRESEEALARKQNGTPRASLVRDPESGIYRPDR